MVRGAQWCGPARGRARVTCFCFNVHRRGLLEVWPQVFDHRSVSTQSSRRRVPRAGDASRTSSYRSFGKAITWTLSQPLPQSPQGSLGAQPGGAAAADLADSAVRARRPSRSPSLDSLPGSDSSSLPPSEDAPVAAPTASTSPSPVGTLPSAGTVPSPRSRLGSSSEDGGPRAPASYAPCDVSRALLLMISNNIGQLAYLNAVRHRCAHVYFAGNFLRRDNTTAMKTLDFAVRYWSKGTMEGLFLKHEGYCGALGAFLSTLADDEPGPPDHA